MERFFSKKSVAVFLTTIILFAVFNIHSAHAGVLSSIGSGFLEALTQGLGTIYSWLLNLVVIPIASFCLAVVGTILDFSIKYTVYGDGFTAMDGAIRSIWTLLRDVANITFIFMLLYAGIQQIINGSMKKDILVSVITAAVLINFSLFFTKIVIDAGNLVATAIYNQIDAGEKSGNASQVLVQSLTPSGFTTGIDLSGRIMAGLDITTIYDVTGSGESALENSTVGDGSNSINGVGGMINSTLKIFKILTLFFVFMFLAVMFVGRYITLVILMATSPVGFVVGVPFIDTFAKKWRSELSQAVMIAPAIMFFLLLTIRLSQYLPTVDNVFISFFNFIFVIFLLTKSMNIVKGMSGTFGALADKIGKVTAGLAVAGVTGGASFAARGAIGGAANQLAGSKWGTRLEGMANSDSKILRGFGRAGTSVLNAGATSSFDARNIPGFSSLGLQADSKLSALGQNKGGQRADIEAGNKKAKEVSEAEEKRAKAYQATYADQQISDKLRGQRSDLEKQLNQTEDKGEQDKLRGEINKINVQIKDVAKNPTAAIEKATGIEKVDFSAAEAKINTAKNNLKKNDDALAKAQADLTKVDGDITSAETELQDAIKTGDIKVVAEKRKILKDLTDKASDTKQKIQDKIEDLQDPDKIKDMKDAVDDATKGLETLQQQQARYGKAGFDINMDEARSVLDTKNRRNDIAREYRAGGLTGLFRRGFVTQKTANQMSEAGESIDKPKSKSEKKQEAKIKEEQRIRNEVNNEK